MTVGSNLLQFSYDAAGTPMAVLYNGTTYYYATNIQGDVIAILDATGAAVVEYTYDAWGNLHTTDGSMKDTLGTTNPLRYRSYIYDTETQLYYLQSRYYNPELGRFLNADSLAATGQGLLGNNMFAYCLNNPLSYVDPRGLCSRDPSMGILIDCGSDWCSESYYGFLLRRYFTNLIEDISNYDKNNQSESKVLASHYFSSYNGVPVVRTNGDRSGSFGILFITRETNTRRNAEDVVRHEYGHVIQLRKLGVVKYALGIMLPSWQEWDTNTNYYARRCEITADIYGGVESRQYTTAEIYSGFNYLHKVDKWGVLAWFDFL